MSKFFRYEDAYVVKLDLAVTKKVNVQGIVDWCGDHIGPGGYKDSVSLGVFGFGKLRVWECELSFWGAETHATFYFLYEKDAVFFKMKWDQ